MGCMGVKMEEGKTREKVIKSADLNGGWSGVGWEKYGEDIAKAWM